MYIITMYDSCDDCRSKNFLYTSYLSNAINFCNMINGKLRGLVNKTEDNNCMQEIVDFLNSFSDMEFDIGKLKYMIDYHVIFTYEQIHAL